MTRDGRPGEMAQFARARGSCRLRLGRLLAAVVLAVDFAAPRAPALDIFNYDAAVNERFQAGTFFTTPVANPSFFLAGWDLSGIGWGAGNYGMTLISPRHFVTAAHVTPAAGTTVSFLNRDGVVKTYTVESTYAVPHSAGVPTDLVVGRLTAAIPAGDHVACYPTAVLNPLSAYENLPVYVFGRYQSAGTNTIDSVGPIDMLPFGSGDGVPDDTILVTDFDAVTGQTQGQDGDSGSPTFVIRHGALALVGTHSAIDTSSTPVQTVDVLTPAYFQAINVRLALDGYSFGNVAALPAPGSADFNANGKAGLLWQNTATGERFVWFMNGTTFDSGRSLGLVPTAWQIAGTGDFNADGKIDIVWQNTATGERLIWLMDGPAFSSGVSLGVVAPAWQIAAVGDLNGDGQPDLVWQNTATGERYLWLMNGTAFASGVSLGVVPTDWQIAAAGDFNGDGKADLVWQNTTTGERFVWFMNGSAFSSGVSLGVIPTDWRIAGAGDFNADGKPDLVWQNLVTGERFIWLMDGPGATASVFVGAIPTQWQIRN